MIVKNDLVFFNRMEVLSITGNAEYPSVLINFISKNNTICLIPKKGIILKRYKNTDFFYTPNIWCFENETIWRMKKNKVNGAYSGSYSLISMQFKFRVNRSEVLKKVEKKDYKGIFFKSGRLYIDDININFRNNIYFRLNNLKIFLDNDIIAIVMIGSNFINNEIAYNKKLEIDSNIQSLGKMDNSVFYKSQLLRNATNYYGDLSKYKYITTDNNNCETLIFKKG